MRFFLVLFLFLPQLIFCQLRNAKEYYPNGVLKYNGKYKICVSRDAKRFTDIYEKRKVGKWIYYHTTGNIKRIENHSKKRSCPAPTYKQGKWDYFSKDGIWYKTERYESDSLIYSEFEISQGDDIYAKVRLKNDEGDTIFLMEQPKLNMLIQNPGFETYYYKPLDIVNTGQNQIEEIIPGWFSPDGATPDYYNDYRSIHSVASHFNGDASTNPGGYVGLMLFYHPNQKYESWEPQNETKYGNRYVYSESIQTELNKNLKPSKKYCLSFNIILSQNAGLVVNQFGVLFSKKSISYKADQFPDSAHIAFDLASVDENSWQRLCHEFKATGQERFLTLGRFSDPDATIISKHDPMLKCELDVNHSAYYLIDDVELFEILDEAQCRCEKNTIAFQMKTELETNYTFEFDERNRAVLENVYFDFDKADIKEASLGELMKLLQFLKGNPNINILLIGHTDHEGSETYNNKLSLDRAKAIKSWLIENGIESNRITCIGKGFSEPLTTNDSIEEKQKNRRVEFQVE